ncbi:hypothetical protein Pcinc_043926 [Petrolisthes cinctipes]|uniref:Uncharacterized protein n=1 Tax=Petrolisthes cinctipes TaxID=88211 RepID=A0AAE1EFQ7_PETCI|nr:hypothetical protein Pcinc_043926 [Petrolisthes cinctipes]
MAPEVLVRPMTSPLSVTSHQMAVIGLARVGKLAEAEHVSKGKAGYMSVESKVPTQTWWKEDDVDYFLAHQVVAGVQTSGWAWPGAGFGRRETHFQPTTAQEIKSRKYSPRHAALSRLSAGLKTFH